MSPTECAYAAAEDEVSRLREELDAALQEIERLQSLVESLADDCERHIMARITIERRGGAPSCNSQGGDDEA